ncbi:MULTISPECIES: hypothetical protein [Cardiobacteriaceae]|uniref:Uncharacterized protein n=1 Tax=Suttonella indologenes TaxID=13276 RepID=A0A380MZG5_9GAMM|nr:MULTISPECIES: hypothetical protein [Cardiobacteriaceae]SUO96867.1 Uncharacterised protein [Suttonella indologenes]
MNNYLPVICPLLIAIACRIFIFSLQCITAEITARKVIKIGVILSIIYLVITFPIFILAFDFYIFPIVSLIVIWVYFIFMSLLYEGYFERMRKDGSLLLLYKK